MGQLHDRLHGGLWHTTKPDRMWGIISEGALIPEPDIDDAERWNTAMGPDFYPISRSLGGISLFDFRDFDPDEYSELYPLSSWQEFIPCRQKWGGSVWLEINRDAIKHQFIPPGDLLERWREGNLGRNIMPNLEAACIGGLPVQAMTSAFLTWNKGAEVRDFDVQNFDGEFFKHFVDEWQADIG